MHRRAFVRLAPLALTVGVAGCTTNGSDGSDGGGIDGNDGDDTTPTQTETDTPSSSPTPTDTPTETETSGDRTVEDASLTVVNRTAGQNVDAAEVTVADDAVAIEGTIWGSDSCKTATLGTVTYDTASDTLRVAVATTDREDAGDVCAQAIQEIDYQAGVTVSGGPPGTVTVTHDDRSVTTTDLA